MNSSAVDRLQLHTRVLPGALSLVNLAEHLCADAAPLCWFDSSSETPELGHQSILCQVAASAFSLGRSCRRIDAQPNCVERLRTAFQRDRDVHDLEKLGGAGRFLGGWIGYLTYESQIDFDPALPDRDITLPYPRIWFMRAERGVTVSHVDQKTTIWDWCRPDREPEDLDRWARLLLEQAEQRPAPDRWGLDSPELDATWYKRSVEEILGRISSGEVYQVNLTAPVRVVPGRVVPGRVVPGRVVPDRVVPGASPLELYRRLRQVSPGDFSGLFRWPGLTLMSSSPELFFSLDDGEIRARPMKGTRARTGEVEDDRRIAAELLGDDKDRAENLIIVDLIRNDLGKVAEIGTVDTSRLFEIEEYSTVFQMTSTVRARLRQGEDVFSVLGATFPPGSMTGAPKVQACHVIRGLEPGPRGIYSGCMGFVDWTGDAVFNVVIRTLVGDNRDWSWSVGGGVVADSSPEREYQEALDKLEALRRTIYPSM